MRRLLAGVMALGLLLGTAKAETVPVVSPEEAMAAEGFWWDVTDGDSTTQSSDTGGTPAETPLPSERSILEEVPSRWLADKPVALAWTEDWWALAYARIPWGNGHCRAVDGRILMLTVLGGAEENATTEVLSFAWDLHTGQQLRLSDLFYDGINYIRHINEAASMALQADRTWDPELFTSSVTQEDLRRPFSGFPADYPHFTIVEGPHGGRQLMLWIAAENPLFSENYGAMLRIPLTDDVSPYGLPWVEVTMALEELPTTTESGFLTEQTPRNPDMTGNHREVYIPRVRLDAELGPEAEARVNETLRTLARRVAAHPLRTIHETDDQLAPVVWFDRAGRTLYVAYHALIIMEVDRKAALLGAMEVELPTGEALDGTGLPASVAAGEAAWTSLRRPGERWGVRGDIEQPPGDYALPEVALYLGAWTVTDGETGAQIIRAAWLDPAGFEVYLEMPMEE